MNLTRLSLRRPVTVTMVALCLGVIGLVASRLLPLEFLPDMEFPALMVQIPYPNSSPAEVERRITRPVEEALATLTDIDRMRSDSGEDGAFIVLFFDWGADLSTKGVEARDKIDAILEQLPEGIERPIVRKFDASDIPVLTLRISSERDLSSAWEMLDRNLARRIRRLDGVSKVELYGVERKEVVIELSADRVAAHGIDVARLGERLKEASFILSAGEVNEGGRLRLVIPDGELESVEALRSWPVNERGLTLGEIAQVRLRDPDRTYGRHLDGHYAIGLNVYKATGANLVEVSDRVLEEVEAIGRLPEMKGISLYVMDNRGDGVRQSLDELKSSGLIGALLSALVLYLFLRHLGLTLLVTLAVPFSLLVTLGMMYFLGFSLNILTMMGLMLSIGMLVDNAVVVVENIQRFRARGDRPVAEATEAAALEVGTAILAGTLTSIIVFLPNVVGEKVEITTYLSHVGVTIVIALTASLLIAKSLIPLLTTRLPTVALSEREPLPRLGSAYRRLLGWSLAHRGWSVLAILLVVASAAWPVSQVKKELFPESDERRLLLQYNLNGQYALPVVEGAVNRIEAYLFAHREELEIKSVYSYFDIGRALSILVLTDKEEGRLSVKEIKKRIREGLPKIAIGTPTFNQEEGQNGGVVSLTLTGESSERLKRLGSEVVRVLSGVEGLTDVRMERSASDQEVRIRVHRERARAHGLDSQSVAEMVAAALRGSRLKPLTTPTGEVTVKVQFRPVDRADLDRLLTIPIRTPAGRRISLSAVADWEIREVPGAIHRENRATAVTIKASLDEVTSEEAREAIRAHMESLALPTGYHWQFGRELDREQQTQTTMLVNMLLALALIYLVMAALFESLLYPLSIITAIGFSVIGVYWFFWATGTTFSFMALIGILVLMGVVVNNGIVMVDHFNHLRWGGMAREAAVLKGARDRLRPILMTVGTTIVGLVPLAVGDAKIGGDGAPYYPMARAIIGGLAFSTLVSLLALPTIYLLLDDLSGWWSRVWARANRVPRLRRT